MKTTPARLSRGLFTAAKRSFLVISCLVLLTTNLLTLTSDIVQSALAASLASLGIPSVYSNITSSLDKRNNEIAEHKRINKKLDSDLKEASKGKHQLLAEKKTLEESIISEREHSKNLNQRIKNNEAKIANLSTKNRKLTITGKNLANKTRELASAHKQLGSAHQALKASTATTKNRVRSLGGKVTQRTLRSASLNITSIPFESVPIAGAAVIAAVTMLELHMSCDTVKDMNDIYAIMDIQPEDDPGVVNTTCLNYINQVDTLLEKAGNGMTTSEGQSVMDSILAKAGIGSGQ